MAASLPQRQYPGTGGETVKLHGGERLFQLVIDKIELILVPAVSGLRPARLQLRARCKGDVADVDRAALAQQRKKALDKRDLSRDGQVVQGIGGDDGVVPVLRQRTGETLRNVAAYDSIGT